MDDECVGALIARRVPPPRRGGHAAAAVDRGGHRRRLRPVPARHQGHHLALDHPDPPDVRRRGVQGRRARVRGFGGRPRRRSHLPRALPLLPQVRRRVQAGVRAQGFHGAVRPRRRSRGAQGEALRVQQRRPRRDSRTDHGPRSHPGPVRGVEEPAQTARAGVPQGVARSHGRPLRRLLDAARQEPRRRDCQKRRCRRGRHGGTVLLRLARHHRPRGVQLRLRIHHARVTDHQGGVHVPAGGGAQVDVLLSVLEPAPRGRPRPSAARV